MAEELPPAAYAAAVSKVAVAQICRTAGYRAAEPSALRALSDIAVHHIAAVARSAAAAANARGRTDCNLLDLIRAFEDLGLLRGFAGAAAPAAPLLHSGAMRELMAFMASVDEIPFPRALPPQPSPPPAAAASFALAGREPPLPHVPRWLPCFPFPEEKRVIEAENRRTSVVNEAEDRRTSVVDGGKRLAVVVRRWLRAESFDFESQASDDHSNRSRLKIVIVGFGNLGQFLARTFASQGHTLLAHSRSDHSAAARSLGAAFFPDPHDLYEQHPDVVVLCTSILSTPAILRSLPLQRLRRSTLFVDVLSVKEFPKNLLLRHLPPGFDILCTHPMFSPESAKAGWAGRPFVYDKVRIANPDCCNRFLDLFEREGCRMVEMSCAEHDENAAEIQFLTHTVRRILAKFDPILAATGGANMVRELRVESFYTRLCDAASSSSSTRLLIFPSASDADSLCALKIVTHVLASDSLSHRPIHLHNLSEQNDQVVVLYTLDDEQQADLAYDFDVSALASGADLNSDDEVDDSVDSYEDSESENEDGVRKRRRVEDESVDPVKLFGKLKREYYRLGTFHGRPSGCLMFVLAHSLRKNANKLLWLVCVSLTDQFVQERLTNERYQASVMELEQHINNSGNLDAVTSVT